MATERDREKDAQLESAMYTNCLLLGLDPAVLGGATAPRYGHFRHSNPRMGEQLLYFLLSALRGPVQSAKDFDKVWPIFDSSQSREFRKIVQGIISELESQGALPRSNSRVSSLATCCGPRFVELLWQLSVHALREVHRRSFAADVASNPLPASLTDVSYLHAAALLPVYKARIALERRKFLNNANDAVHRQAMHSSLAHEMTAEFRVLCAEEAYLQQELEKLQDMRNKAKLDAELWDDRVIGSPGQTSHIVSKATRLWESLLARKSQHEVLASGPIEDLIAHREHRYRISGSSLLAAMESSYNDQNSHTLLSSPDDRSGKVLPTVDVAEVLRRWTHALQRIHKQSLNLAKANDGEGPELLRDPSDPGSSGHAESLTTTLMEHRQHLISIEGLINQLKEAVPAMQKSISDLNEEVNRLSSSVPVNDYNRSLSPIEAQSSGRAFEHRADEVSEVTSKLSTIQLDKATASPAMKLPQLFSFSPNSSGKSVHTSKRAALAQTNQAGGTSERKSVNQPHSSEHMENDQGDESYMRSLRRSVRESALAVPSTNKVLSQDLQEKKGSDDSEHFFMPLSKDGISEKDVDTTVYRTHDLVLSSPEISSLCTDADKRPSAYDESMLHETPNLLHKSEGFGHVNGINGNMLPMNLDASGQSADLNFDDSMGQVSSPPLLMESSFFTDLYEDLLAPLSETDAALMEQ